MKSVILRIDDQACLELKLKEMIKKLIYCDDCLIYFKDTNNKIVLYHDFIRPGLSVFVEVLEDLISNRLALHESIVRDVGYMWNQLLHAEPADRDPKIFCEEDGFWVAEVNLVWSASGDDYPSVETWLYNNDEGEIILEITPVYKWHFDDPEPGENYITYEEFMLNYKPILFRTIPKDVAQEWVDQAQNLLNIIEQNTLAAEGLEAKQNE